MSKSKKPAELVPTESDRERFGKLLNNTPMLNNINEGLYSQALRQTEARDKWDEYLATDDDRSDHFSWKLGQVFESNGLRNPMQTYDGKQKAKMITNSHMYKDDEIEKMQPKQQALADLQNQLIMNNGALPHPDFLKRTFDHSMLGGFAKMFGADPLGDSDFKFHADGLSYKGNKAHLNDEELNVFNKYINRISGKDAMANNNFMEKAFEVGVSFAWDMPLIMATSGAIGGALGSSKVVGDTISKAYLGARTGNFATRQLVNLANNAATFSILGIPQTVDSLKLGIGDGLEAIGHSLFSAGLMTVGGLAGSGLGKLGTFTPVVKEILKARPALKEELGGIFGSGAFGYASSKFAGQEDEDALATALAFIGTHAGNPRAYRRLIEEHKTSKARIRTVPSEDGKRMREEYFLEKDGKGILIDEEALKRDGRIIEVEGAEPLNLEGKMSEFPYYNEVHSNQSKSFKEALTDVEINRVSKQFYEDFKKSANKSDKGKKEFEDNKEMYVIISNLLARSKAVDSWSKISEHYKLPDKNTLAKETVKITNETGIPYNQVKRMLITGFMGKDFSAEIQKGAKEGMFTKALSNIEKAYIEGVDDIIFQKQMRDVDVVLKDYLKANPNVTAEQARAEYFDIMTSLRESGMKFDPKDRTGLTNLIYSNNENLIREMKKDATKGSPLEKILDLKIKDFDAIAEAKRIEEIVPVNIKRDMLTGEERKTELDKTLYPPRKGDVKKDIMDRSGGKERKEVNAKFKEKAPTLMMDMNEREKNNEPDQIYNFAKDLEEIGGKLPQAVSDILDVANKLGITIVDKRLKDAYGQYHQYDHAIAMDLVRLTQYIDSRGQSSTGQKGLDGTVATFLHEAVHGLTYHMPREKKVMFDEEMRDMQKHLREIMLKDTTLLDRVSDMDTIDKLKFIMGQVAPEQDTYKAGHYEILTWSMTNPFIAKYLTTIPPTERYLEQMKGASTGGLFGQLMDWMKRLVGATGVEKTLFDQVQQTADKYIKDLMPKEKHLNNLGVETISDTPGRVDKYVKEYDKTKEDDYKDIQLAEGLRSEVETRQETEPTKEKNIGLKQDKAGLTNEQTEPKQIYNQEVKRAETLRYGNEISKKLNETRIPREESGKRAMNPDLDKLVEYEKINQERVLADGKEFTKGMDGDPLEIKKSLMDAKEKGMDLWGLAKKYEQLNLAPIFMADISKRYKDDVYLLGEEMIRLQAYDYNSVMEWSRGYAKAKPFRKLMGNRPEHMQNPATPEGKQFMDAFKNYSYARRTGQLEKNLTWEEFGKWAKFNDQQMDVLHRQRRATQSAVNRMKKIKMKDLITHDNALGNFLTDKQIKDTYGIDVKKDGREEFNKLVAEDKAMREQIARRVVNKLYEGWGDNVYYNETRPTNPEYHMIDLTRKTGKQIENDNKELVDEVERIYSYGRNKEEAQQYIDQKIAEGWELADTYQIKDIIKSKDYNRLTSQQIQDLANKGHLDLNDPKVTETIKKLEEATVRGINVHKLQKEFIEGMHYTPNEMMEQFDAFVRQATHGAHKSFYLKSIDKNITKWAGEWNANPKRTKAEQNELEYSIRYLNQLKQVEKVPFIDAIRGAGQSFQVGLFKPSFFVQQATQIFQTTFSSSIAEAKGQGVKAFGQAIPDAIKATLQLRAFKQFGKDVRYPPGEKGISRESLERIRTLELMGKIGGIGVEELTAENAEIPYNRDSKSFDKYFNGFKNVSNIAGRAAEKWTRMVTAMTYEKIGLQKGLEGKELIRYMADGIDKNMSEWGKGGRAPIFNSKKMGATESTLQRALAKSFLTYKTFSFYNYGLWRGMIKNRQFGALTSKVIAGVGMAGVTKFPLFASAFLLADLFSDEDMDNKAWQLSDALDDALPGDVGSLLHRGMGSWVGWDLRETFGQDSPLISDLYANSWANSWYGKMGEIIGGAPLGFTQDVVQGLDNTRQYIVDGVLSRYHTDEEKKKILKGMSKALPVSIKNIYNALSLGKHGVEFRGKQMVAPDDLDAWDLWSKGLSFTIEKQTRAYADGIGGVEAKYNDAKEILRRGATHRKEFTAHLREQGYKGDAFKTILEEEMKQVVEDMNEARATIKELEAQVREIKRKRKQ